MRRAAKGALAAAAAVLAAWAGFVGVRSRAVARELTDPPFYHPQPLARVEATYRELAAGTPGADPGGAWETFRAGERQVWLLRRRVPAQWTVLMLHGFGDDRWGTSPALKWFPALDAAIFTYLGRDDAMRAGGPAPMVTFGAREAREVVEVVHALEARGVPRNRVILLGRSLGASVGLLALARLEAEGRGPLGGIIWEGAPASSRDFAQRLVEGPVDRFWHPWVAPAVGQVASALAARWAGYDRDDTDLLARTAGMRLATPSLCFIAAQDRLAPPRVQRALAARFAEIRVVEAPTWHLHCAETLGPAYDRALADAVRAWTTPRR
ncbi:alpha/beta hydrolase family protein [Mesoterricola sediminis]|uniref:Alpha/beta hydrolase n=1 Tax=Mesoterricola sediminis TaxID=2927980 RepID=A0AA48GW41_9BACT|nr:hypothetical protein [Mesoterricola sediminis]BDU76735.1 hypothetical protein METESE_16930 [Mesoterricola sediminis]